MAANATAVMVALATANDGGQRWQGTVLITASAIAFSLAGLFTRLPLAVEGRGRVRSSRRATAHGALPRPRAAVDRSCARRDADGAVRVLILPRHSGTARTAG